MSGSGGNSSKRHKYSDNRRDDDDDDDRRDDDDKETQPSSGFTKAAHQAKLNALLEGFGSDMNPIVQQQINQGYGQQLQDAGLPLYGQQGGGVDAGAGAGGSLPSFSDWRQAQVDAGIERPYFDYLRNLTPEQRQMMESGTLETPWSGGGYSGFGGGGADSIWNGFDSNGTWSDLLDRFRSNRDGRDYDDDDDDDDRGRRSSSSTRRRDSPNYTMWGNKPNRW